MKRFGRRKGRFLRSGSKELFIRVFLCFFPEVFSMNCLEFFKVFLFEGWEHVWCLAVFTRRLFLEDLALRRSCYLKA